ncbi:MAG: iron ABC transporter permease, partial [Actinomycetota bacterium]|nr:iron ABC transporter permease [Actinomycetota bacterium]
MTGARAAPRARALPSLPLTAAALAVAALACLPLAYLVVRAASGGTAAWSVLERPRTLEVVLRTVVLVVAVTAAATAVGVSMAWLVVRSDLPLRRFWAVAAALPLVVPSYVSALALIAALGPGGALRGAIEALPGVRGAPEIYGLPGALLALTTSTYPYVYLLTAAALRR